MKKIEIRIKNYLARLEAEKLGLKGRIKVSYIKRLGMGASNLNYLVKINKKKFVFRLNMDSKDSKKSEKEFKALKVVERIKIAPRPYLYENSNKLFNSGFIILDYLEGRSLNKLKYTLSNKLIKELVKILSKLHNIKITSKIKVLPIKMANYKSYLDYINSELSYLKKNLENKKLLEALKKSSNEIKKRYIVNKKFDLVISQNDFMEDNLIVRSNKYFLVDFEDLCLNSREAEIARVLVDFGREFSEKQRRLFLDEYFKENKIKNKNRFHPTTLLISLSI